MENIIEELVLGQHPSLAGFFIKLLYHAVLHTHHGQVVRRSYRGETLLKIPVIRKYRKQQNHCRLLLRQQNLSHQTVIAMPLGLIALVIYRIFHDDQVRLNLTLAADIALIAHHAKLGGSTADAGLHIVDILLGALAAELTETLKGLPCITLGINWDSACSLRDGAADKCYGHILASSRLLNRIFKSQGIAQIHQRLLQHLAIFRTVEVYHTFLLGFRSVEAVL